jgi:hypothetical protein
MNDSRLVDGTCERAVVDDVGQIDERAGDRCDRDAVMDGGFTRG